MELVKVLAALQPSSRAIKPSVLSSLKLMDMLLNSVRINVGADLFNRSLKQQLRKKKNMVYQEIMPHALVLMTDVFGNYVVQKFFEHGLAPQRRELANKLLGHVLTLSLQTYGCRVIQKAIEVVDLDQKIEMVQEFDGNIMRCVRDQNGNHVIQKCIECVPEDAIDFIISTFLIKL
ncbi:hypothetical protein RYX36_018518 [Vicia faba]